MCNYQTWFYNTACGYVVECVQFNKLQAAFGNIVLTLSAPQYQSFRQYLVQAVEAQLHNSAANVKCIQIQTPAQGVSFLLTKQELLSLQNMIESADNEMKAAGLLKLFNESVS